MQFVLVIGMRLRQISELLGKTKAVANVLGRNEILSGLYARIEIEDLMRSTSGDEYGITETLNDSIASHTVFFMQTISQNGVQVPSLVEHGREEIVGNGRMVLSWVVGAER